MAAALTIALLVAFSVTVVRVASVAMRLTGLPDSIARFQCISALTGTGFTTSESEMIVNYPTRRRILVGLMVLGNFGLVSIGATLIVTFVRADASASAVTLQAGLIFAAIASILLLLTNKTLDRLLCGAIRHILIRTTALGQRRSHRLLQLDNGFSITAHTFAGPTATAIEKLPLNNPSLKVLAIHGDQTHQNDNLDEKFSVTPGDRLICYGSDHAQKTFEDALAILSARASSID